MNEAEKAPQNRKHKLGCLLLFTLPLLVAGVVISDYRQYLDSTVPITEPQVLEIDPGRNADEILEILGDEGLVERRLYAEMFLKLNGMGAELKAGSFEIDPGMTVRSLLEALTVAPEDRQIRLTFPEGWRLDQMAERVEELEIASAAEFEETLLDRVTAEERQPSLEGFLFPDTYFVTASTSVEALQGRMITRHREVWSELAENHRASMALLAEQLGLEPIDFVIVASIVEAEATVLDEYATIARVIYNRLSQGMRLQMDPTCAYPAGFREMSLREACHDSSNPYSTYVIDGLPPTPICNPGRDALEAALRPDLRPESADLLYFVARQDGSGRHVFAETYDEHRANVRRYLQ